MEKSQKILRDRSFTTLLSSGLCLCKRPASAQTAKFGCALKSNVWCVVHSRAIRNRCPRTRCRALQRCLIGGQNETRANFVTRQRSVFAQHASAVQIYGCRFRFLLPNTSRLAVERICWTFLLDLTRTVRVCTERRRHRLLCN